MKRYLILFCLVSTILPTLLAQEPERPFITVFSRTARNAGTVRATSLGDATAKMCRLRFVEDVAEPWAGSADVTAFGFERSFDGGESWQHWVSAGPPFGRGKDGAPPSLGARATDGTFIVRPFVRLARRTTCELEARITP